MPTTLAAAAENAPKERSDRRLYQRYAIGLPATIQHDGQSLQGALADLSLGGAGFRPAAAALVGTMVDLRIGRGDLTMRARLVSVTSEMSHLAFDLDADSEAALTFFLLAGT